MKPIIPFEPVGTEEIPTGAQWAGQVKWDGVRVLTYWDGQNLKLYNRKLNERTFHYPELQHISKYCSAASVILDGEIIALKKGKPSFYEVMKRDGIRNLRNVEKLCRAVPVNYMIFDVIYLNGKWINSLPLVERQRHLNEIITPGNYVQLVENFENAQGLYDVIKTHCMEGIVIKDLSSKYKINGKDKRWRKKKFYRDLIAVVGGVTRRNNIVNSLLLGLFDSDGRLWYVGHAGTGKLTQKDWRDLTEGIKPLIQPAMPFANTPPRIKEALWLQPRITVKVKYTEWTEGHSLRHPSIESFVNVPARECVLK
jgi:bifunctional non-homologous end joining protein LigD